MTIDVELSVNYGCATMGVLVVDDLEALRRAIARGLTRQGFEVVTAGSFAEARALDGVFESGVFDIDLGDGNGVDLAEELLSQGRVAHAVFHTGAVDEAVLERARRLGVVVPKDGSGVQDVIEAIQHSAMPDSSVRATSRRPPHQRPGRKSSASSR